MKNKINLLIVAAVLIGLGLACGGDKTNTTNRTNAVAATSPANVMNVATATPVKVDKSDDATTKKEAPAEPATGVTMANFNRLKTGMRYAEAVKILGSEGEVMSENEIAGHHTIMYKWDSSGLGNMNAMFQNGKLVQKAQFGLK